MQGFIELKTPHDLLAKLRHDLAQMEKAPLDTYMAFNFFVTAEHMLDWVFPDTLPNDPVTGKKARKRREDVKDSETILQICSHIANNAKHYETTAKHHVSVTSTYMKPGGYDILMIASVTPFRSPRLVVDLVGDAEIQLGKQIAVLVLARQVLAYWEANLDKLLATI